MRKTYPLQVDGKHPDRVLDAVKHDIHRYQRRERRRALPEGTHFWDFDCRLGTDKDTASAVHAGELIAQLDALARGGAAQCYVEMVARASVRAPRTADPAQP